MGFSNEFSSIFGVEKLAKKVVVQMIDDCFVAIEGVKQIIEISKTEIFFESVLSRKIKVTGSDFVVSKLEKNELYIKGTLESVVYV